MNDEVPAESIPNLKPEQKIHRRYADDLAHFVSRWCQFLSSSQSKGFADLPSILLIILRRNPRFRYGIDMYNIFYIANCTKALATSENVCIVVEMCFS
jgi:hypothetical protein